jgi:hypothetical protein
MSKETTSPEFNLLYEDEKCQVILGRRRKDVRRIVLEDGRSFSHSYMSANFKYLGRVNENKPRLARPVWEYNLNGFKVRTKTSKGNK